MMAMHPSDTTNALTMVCFTIIFLTEAIPVFTEHTHADTKINHLTQSASEEFMSYINLFQKQIKMNLHFN